MTQSSGMNKKDTNVHPHEHAMTDSLDLGISPVGFSVWVNELPSTPGQCFSDANVRRSLE